MYDPIPEVLTACNAISGVSLQEGMPDSFLSGNAEQIDWTTYKAIGWVDISDISAKILSRRDGDYRERKSKVVFLVQFYTLNNVNMALYKDSIDNAICGLGYIRKSLNIIRDRVSNTQTIPRAIIRYEATVDVATGAKTER